MEAPNMNSIMERFIRTVRREALDNSLLTRRSRVLRVLHEYVALTVSDRNKESSNKFRSLVKRRRPVVLFAGVLF
jgi:hypothetical protein